MIIKLTHAHIIGAFISYLIGVFIVPLVIEFSQKEGLVDVPNERKIHKKPVSRLGGIAIWSSAMLTFLVLVLLSYYPYGSLLSGILLGGSLMFLLGLVDDVYNLDAKFKLFIQLTVATIVYLLGVQIDTIFNPFGGAPLKLGLLSYPITVLWIAGISNAVNFIDQTKQDDKPTEERIVPKLSDDDKKSRNNRIVIKSIISVGVVAAVALLGYIIYNIYLLLL